MTWITAWKAVWRELWISPFDETDPSPTVSELTADDSLTFLTADDGITVLTHG